MGQKILSLFLSICRWVMGGLLLFASIGAVIEQAFLLMVCLLVMGGLLVPPICQWFVNTVKKTFKITLNRYVLIFIWVVLFFVVLAGAEEPEITGSQPTPMQEEVQEKPIEEPIETQEKAQEKPIEEPIEINDDTWQKWTEQAESLEQKTQNALTTEDWQNIVSSWTEVVSRMKSVPSDHPNYNEAQQKVTAYQKKLNYAKVVVNEKLSEIEQHKGILARFKALPIGAKQANVWQLLGTPDSVVDDATTGNFIFRWTSPSSECSPLEITLNRETELVEEKKGGECGEAFAAQNKALGGVEGEPCQDNPICQVGSLKTTIVESPPTQPTIVESPPTQPSIVESVPTQPTNNCDPNYTGACIPTYPPDLNCGDIAARRFQSVGSDPHGFDRDKDGIACES